MIDQLLQTFIKINNVFSLEIPLSTLKYEFDKKEVKIVINRLNEIHSRFNKEETKNNIAEIVLETTFFYSTIGSFESILKNIAEYIGEIIAKFPTDASDYVDDIRNLLPCKITKEIIDIAINNSSESLAHKCTCPLYRLTKTVNMCLRNKSYICYGKSIFKFYNNHNEFKIALKSSGECDIENTKVILKRELLKRI